MTTSDLPETMSAVQIEQTGGPEMMKYRTDVPLPVPAAGKDEVLIKVDYAGVNYIDTYFRTGLYKAACMPYTLGVECSGTIVSIGAAGDNNDENNNENKKSRPQDLKPGDPVMAYCPFGGTYAAYAVAPKSKTYALPPSHHKTPQKAAATLIGGLTALSLIREAHPVKAGDWVLVPAAAGGTGQWLCQLLAAIDARVIGTASTDEKLQVARRAGAQVTLNSSLLSDDELAKRVMEATDGKGVVAAFDGVGKATFESSMKCLARKGTMVTFGNASGPIPDVALFTLTPKNLKLCRPSLNGYIVTHDEFVTYCDDLLALVDKHDIPVDIYKVYPLKDAARAHQDLESRKTTGKLLLQP